jgi:hypothetical protein
MKSRLFIGYARALRVQVPPLFDLKEGEEKEEKRNKRLAGSAGSETPEDAKLQFASLLTRLFSAFRLAFVFFLLLTGATV